MHVVSGVYHMCVPRSVAVPHIRRLIWIHGAVWQDHGKTCLERVHNKNFRALISFFQHMDEMNLDFIIGSAFQSPRALRLLRPHAHASLFIISRICKAIHAARQCRVTPMQNFKLNKSRIHRVRTKHELHFVFTRCRHECRSIIDAPILEMRKSDELPVLRECISYTFTFLHCLC